jgi:AP-2 complex subunit beta-1
VGKALPDSPALNSHSRAVLIPLPRVQLPSESIVVRGPGPIEPDAPNGGGNGESSLLPPVPPKGVELMDDNAEDATSEHDDQEQASYDSRDPYANLDGAFGGYLADAPQPMNEDRLF